MRDDVVARAFEVLVDALVEALVGLLAQVCLLEELDERGGRLLDEKQRGCLQGLDESL